MIEQDVQPNPGAEIKSNTGDVVQDSLDQAGSTVVGLSLHHADVALDGGKVIAAKNGEPLAPGTMIHGEKGPYAYVKDDGSHGELLPGQPPREVTERLAGLYGQQTRNEEDGEPVAESTQGESVDGAITAARNTVDRISGPTTEQAQINQSSAEPAGRYSTAKRPEVGAPAPRTTEREGHLGSDRFGGGDDKRSRPGTLTGSPR